MKQLITFWRKKITAATTESTTTTIITTTSTAIPRLSSEVSSTAIIKNDVMWMMWMSMIALLPFYQKNVYMVTMMGFPVIKYIIFLTFET